MGLHIQAVPGGSRRQDELVESRRQSASDRVQETECKGHGAGDGLQETVCSK